MSKACVATEAYMSENIDESAFYHFGILPAVCIYSAMEDQYSKMYVPRNKCDCGSDKWNEESWGMIIGHYGGIPVHKQVQGCAACGEVRLADHIGVKDE